MFEPMSERTLKIINPPNLIRLVRVRVLRSFCVGGRPIAVGEEVEVEFHTARSLMATGKCVVSEEHQT